MQGKLGRPAYLENWIATITSLTSEESSFKVTFDWDNEIGVPGAFLIKKTTITVSSILEVSRLKMYQVKAESILFAIHGFILQTNTERTVFSSPTR